MLEIVAHARSHRAAARFTFDWACKVELAGPVKSASSREANGIARAEERAGEEE